MLFFYKQLVLRAVAEDLISASKGAALLNCPLDDFLDSAATHGLIRGL